MLVSIMKTILCLLFMAASLAVASPVSLDVVPAGISVQFGRNQEKKTSGMNFIGGSLPAVELEMILRASRKGVELAVGNAEADLSLEDSTGKNLGKATFQKSYVKGRVEEGEYGCSVGVPTSPAPGARWIHVKGHLPVQVLDREEKMDPVTLKMEKNAVVNVEGNMKLKVNKVVAAGNSLKVELELSRKGKGAQVEKMLFRNMDGTELKAEGKRQGFYTVNEDYTGNYEYALPAGTAELQVVLVKKAGEEVQVPLDLKVGLGGAVN